jgi:hypothetical protein
VDVALVAAAIAVAVTAAIVAAAAAVAVATRDVALSHAGNHLILSSVSISA